MSALFERIFELDRIRIRMRNTGAAVLKYRRWLDAVKSDEDAAEPDKDLRDIFVWAAAHIVEHHGFTWTPPAATADRAELERSYQEWMAALPVEILQACNRLAGELHRALSDQIEKPDAELTPDEAADPNS